MTAVTVVAMTTEPADPQVPPAWQRRRNKITRIATDASVLARSFLSRLDPPNLGHLHEGLTGLRDRLHASPIDRSQEPEQPDPDPIYEEAVERFRAALDAIARYPRRHSEIDATYREELRALVTAAEAFDETAIG